MRRLLLLAALLAVAAPVAAHAEPGSASRDGKVLTVSKATGLAEDGEAVRVRGSGYDRSKGVYVAFCVDNGDGQVPTPCGGGADTEGSSGNSVWISDLPPAYGTGLAQPYGQGGSFDVEIAVRAVLRTDDPGTEEDEGVDCRVVRCAVVTRNDHTRSEDRGQDLRVPISFGKTTAGAPAPVPAPVPTATRPSAPEPAGAAPPPVAPVTGRLPVAASPGSPQAAADSSAPEAVELLSPAADPAPAPGAADQALPAVATADSGASLPVLGVAGLLVLGLGGALLRRRRRA